VQTYQSVGNGVGDVPKKGASVGGPTVNQGAVNQEQANQQQGEQYAQTQQQNALAAINSWLAQNKAPVSGAPALTPPPGGTAPTTIGGGTAPGSAQPQQPPGQTMRPPMQNAMAPQQPPTSGGIPPQLRQSLIAAMRGQGTM
jgi:hypothetical protein